MQEPADYSDRYRTEGNVKPLLQAILSPINSDIKGTQVTMQLGKFVTDVYMPYAQEQLRKSTFQDNRRHWKLYLAHLCSDLWIRDVPCCDVQAVINEVAQHHDIARSTLSRVKALLSAIFKLAKQRGSYDGQNPCTDVAIPKGRQSEETHAYSAWSFHGLIKDQPPEVWMAIGPRERIPHRNGVPMKFVRFSGDALTQGVQNLNLDGVPIRVYSPMKSVADFVELPQLLHGFPLVLMRTWGWRELT
jgi:hypothetical protein